VDAAAAGAAQAVGNLDNGTVADYANAAKQGAKTGAEVGIALPAAGAALGTLYRSAIPFFARPAADMGRTATGLLASSITPRAAATLDTLGPQAVLPDASPSFQGLAQGVAAKPGPAADLVVDTLAARAAKQPTRLASDLTENLGPAMSPVELEASMTARQKAAGPLYESALQNAPAVDTTNALATIGEQLNGAPTGSPMRRALESARTMLQQESNGDFRPVTDARTLLNARRQLDTMIDRSTFGACSRRCGL
jgi:hypothetical protein